LLIVERIEIMADDEQLEDFVPEPENVGSAAAAAAGTAPATVAETEVQQIGGFKDLFLKKELSKAIADAGFEQPSEVQMKALPQAILGSDILAQAKAGRGKTAVYVFALLEQIRPTEDKKCQAVVIAHVRELVIQIESEFKRFNKYLPKVTVGRFIGGSTTEAEDVDNLTANGAPTVVVGTPGRLASLVKKGHLDVSNVHFFVWDEFDTSISETSMRADVQAVFLKCPKDKQVIMMSATMTPELCETAKKYMRGPVEIYVDQGAKLTLSGLTQFYLKTEPHNKNKHLFDILDRADFTQCIIFVRQSERARVLCKLLRENEFPGEYVSGSRTQAEREQIFERMKKNEVKICVCTDVYARGVDLTRINLVIQYDMSESADTYLHRVGRAGRFNTKGLVIAFLTPEQHRQENGTTYTDQDVLDEVQRRFACSMNELKADTKLDCSSYKS